MSPDPVRHADTIIFPASLDPQAVSVVRRLREAGYESYLVGGCVRDLLLGHIPKDFDASTEARPRQIRRVFRNCRVIGRRFKLAHVHFGSHIIEVATFRRNPTETDEARDSEVASADGETPGTDPTGDAGERSDEVVREETAETGLDRDMDADDLLITRDNVYGTAEEDTLRRDFTINALLYDVLTDEVIDYVGGVNDVENKILRTIGNPVIRIAEDPVRMLRAVKFTARLGLTMEPALDAAMRSSAEQIDRSAPPRVLEEIYKMLTCGAAGRALELLLGYGLLERLLPELSEYWKERPEECVRLGAALDHVDKASRRVSNSFVLALLFHDVWRETLDGAERMDPLTAARDLIAPAAQRMNIPRRDVSNATQLLLNQSRLERSRRGRRFRMQDFLARDTTVRALDLLYVRCLAGLADPECHARWAMRLAEHHGDGAIPGAPTAAPDRDTTEGGSPRKKRRRGGRRRSGARRNEGGADRERSDSATAEEGSSSNEGRRRQRSGPGSTRSGRGGGETDRPARQSQDGPDTRRDVPTAGSPDQGSRRSRAGARTDKEAGKPAADATASGQEAGHEAGQGSRADATGEPPTSGIAGRLKGLFRRVIGRSHPRSARETPAPAKPTSATSGGGQAGPARDAARANGAKSDPEGSSPAAEKTGDRRGRETAADQSSETGGGAGTGSSSSSRRRRRRRGSGSGDGRSAGTDAAGSGSDNAATGEPSSDKDAGEGQNRRRRRSRGGSAGGDASRKRTSSSSGRSKGNRGDRSATGNRGKSSRTRSKTATPKNTQEKSKDSGTDPSGRHPEDVEDMFDW